jgi:cation diffusion facilitator CzcD-associated flavoprotein CzcO
MPEEIETDYVVVGAGAAGMAFTDALLAHSDATVTLVDRRHAPGGHWIDAYPYVRLHQPTFYGVASGSCTATGAAATANLQKLLSERN